MRAMMAPTRVGTYRYISQSYDFDLGGLAMVTLKAFKIYLCREERRVGCLEARTGSQ